MNNVDLGPEVVKRWQLAQAHLQKCIDLMPSDHKEDDVEASVDYVREFLKREEYTLAVEEMVRIGKLNVFSKAYWTELLTAAQTMQLEKTIKDIEEVLQLKQLQ